MMHATTGIAIMIAAHVLGRYASAAVLERASVSEHQQSTSMHLLAAVIHIALLAIAAMVVMQLFGLQMTALIAVLSTIGIAVGLALQGTLTDFAAGVLMMATNRYHIGDVVQLEGSSVLGRIIHVGVLATTLFDTDAMVHVVVPNRKLYENTVVNHTRLGTPRTVLFNITVSNANRELGDVMENLKADVAKHPAVLKHPPVTVDVGKVHSCGTDLEIRVSIKPGDFPNSENVSVVSNILTQIRGSLVAHDVQLGQCGVRFGAVP